MLYAFITVGTAPLVAALTWWLSRRKQAAETESSIATGAHTAVETILQVLEELREENVQLRNELKEFNDVE